MALPYSYSRNVDTLFAIAADTISGDPINLINEGGEKLLPELAAKGRVFMVNDAKQVSHPVLHADGGGVSRDYLPGVITGVTGGHALDNVAAEILSHAKFDMIAGSRNISFPQDMPDGNQLDYMVNLLRSSTISLFNREESLLVTGATDGGTTVLANGCMTADDSFYDADIDGVRPLSILGLIAAGTSASGDDGDLNTTNESWGGLKVDDVAQWAPQHIIPTTGAADAEPVTTAALEAAIQKAVLQCTFNGVEAPDTILMGTDLYEHMLSAYRGRLSPIHLMEDSAHGTEFFMIAGCKVIRHRMLNATDNAYDLRGDDDACLPVYLLNLKSLRMNIVSQDMNITDGQGFLSSPIDGVFPHPTSTNLFKRVGWKRCYSLDNGRRSFGYLDGIKGTA